MLFDVRGALPSFNPLDATGGAPPDIRTITRLAACETAFITVSIIFFALLARPVPLTSYVAASVQLLPSFRAAITVAWALYKEMVSGTLPN